MKFIIGGIGTGKISFDKVLNECDLNIIEQIESYERIYKLADEIRELENQRY